MLPLLAIACQQSRPVMVWPIPDELPPLAQRAGAETTLDVYVRPGLGRGAPLQARPRQVGERWWPEDPALFGSGQLTVLWVSVDARGVSTWAGHDAPWRADCATGPGCYAIDAPVTALTALAAELDLPSPPALVAIGLDARADQLAVVVDALHRAGIDAHAVVAADGRPPVAGPEPATLRILPLGPEASPACTRAFHPAQTWADVVAQLPDCEAVHVQALAPAAESAAPRWGSFGGLGDGLTRRRSRGRPTFGCSVELGDVRHSPSISPNAIRPELEPEPRMDGSAGTSPELQSVRRCAQDGQSTGTLHATLELEAGVPAEVALSHDGEVGLTDEVLACLRDELAGWRFSTDATGRVQLDVEVACTAR